MHLATFIGAVLLTGLVQARSGVHIENALPGGTEIEACGPNKALKARAAAVDKIVQGLASLNLNLTAAVEIRGGSGTLTAYDRHNFDTLDEVEFEFCKDIAEGHCPVRGHLNDVVLAFETKGRHFWDIDLSLDVFDAGGSKQVMCLYGPAAPKPDDEVVRNAVGSKKAQQIVVDIHLDM